MGSSFEVFVARTENVVYPPRVVAPLCPYSLQIFNSACPSDITTHLFTLLLLLL